MPAAIAAVAIAGGGLLAAGELVSPDRPFGYFGAFLLSALGAFTLWRAGTLRAWRETAEARAQRISDLEREAGELRAELALPDRFAELLGVMGDMAVRQDAAAVRRLEEAFARLDARWLEFNTAAEGRSARLENLIRQVLQPKEEK